MFVGCALDSSSVPVAVLCDTVRKNFQGTALNVNGYELLQFLFLYFSATIAFNIFSSFAERRFFCLPCASQLNIKVNLYLMMSPMIPILQEAAFQYGSGGAGSVAAFQASRWSLEDSDLLHFFFDLKFLHALHKLLSKPSANRTLHEIVPCWDILAKFWFFNWLQLDFNFRNFSSQSVELER